MIIDNVNIVLIGFRGTGKTTIGRILARRLGKGFVDADEYLEQKEKRTIRDIFQEDGEGVFREIETKVIQEICSFDDKVIATGGGAVLREENVRNLKKRGVLIFLNTDINIIYKRIYGDKRSSQKRPNLTHLSNYQEIKYLLECRRPLYDKIADFVIDTAGTSLNTVVRKIIALIHGHVRDLRKE
ncbi:MAG: shikimate kinase [wastewater metagenome]|nr:shikimate kinase [Candidatus Loosdrechtia aerotolerans]